MKRLALILLLLPCFPIAASGAQGGTDDLLRGLNDAIAGRDAFTARKMAHIEELRRKKSGARGAEEIYRINSRIIDSYESFICDSAEHYILENTALARELGREADFAECRLRLAFVYSLSGLFLQADEVFRSIDYGSLSDGDKCRYHWNKIRYYENLIEYSNDSRHSADYQRGIVACRDSLMRLLAPGTKEYLTEDAFRSLAGGQPQEAVRIFGALFGQQRPDTHQYAMAAMCLAKAYGAAGDTALQERFLILAATTDIRQAVRDNEALLALATLVFGRGDIERAYSYISFALDDANFYNSRFKNTVIARLYPIIESSYLYKLDKQRRNLRFYATMSSLLVAALAIALFFYFRQTRIVNRAQLRLRKMAGELIALNRNLDEANLVKERYLGYFMNQCAVYVNRLDRYRREISLKVRNRQFDRLGELQALVPGGEEEELCRNFDRAFLNLYPNFVEQFNALLHPASRYALETGRLNTELRIFALIRLGVRDVNQIADFLHCSAQTVYNYKSKIKRAATDGGAHFEQTVLKLGSLSLETSAACLPETEG